jgi:hypothetical protein
MDARGEGTISAADSAWLDAHTKSCARCGKMSVSRERLALAMRDLRGEKAPEGFAGRVLLAARARGRAAEVESEDRPMLPFMQIAIGGVLALLVVVGLATMIAISGPGSSGATGGKIGVSGSSAVGLEANDHPQFLVRAPGLGAAQARSQIAPIIEAHHGTHHDAGGALVARIPRAELIGITQDLAHAGRYKMSRIDERELGQDIVIRFELE